MTSYHLTFVMSFDPQRHLSSAIAPVERRLMVALRAD